MTNNFKNALKNKEIIFNLNTRNYAWFICSLIYRFYTIVHFGDLREFSPDQDHWARCSVLSSVAFWRGAGSY